MSSVLATAIDGDRRQSPCNPGLLLRTSALVLRTSALALQISVAAAISGYAIAGDTTESAAESDLRAPEPTELIDDMSDALRTLNYEGVFVHAQGTSLTSMHIVHASNDDGEFERLLSLDGEARELIRSNSMVTCIWPGSESVVVSKTKPRELLPRIDASLTSNMHYSFQLGAADRVAGREAYVVNVIPDDRYRYGYRFWIDKQTRMLLRSMLLDGPDSPVEQVIFTQIEFHDSIDSSQFDPVLNYPEDDLLTWLEPKKADAIVKAASKQSQQKQQADKVRFASLPGGYRKITETFSATATAGKAGPSSHVMLSDGMASVSVYVEYVAAANQSAGSLGLVRMGAMNAYGVGTDNALITVVGEVPETTIKAIAASVILIE